MINLSFRYVNKLNDSKISQEEYNLAKQLLDNSLNVSESSNELFDFDSKLLIIQMM